MSEEFSESTDVLSRYALSLAVAGAEAGVAAIHRELLKPAGDDTDDGEVLIQDPEHAGTPARAIDARAQEAVRIGLESAYAMYEKELSLRADRLYIVGEESGSPTQMLKDRSLVARTDPLDGTTNAVNMLQAFSSVVTIDYFAKAGGPCRHVAGAIFGGDFDLCWVNESPRDRTKTGVYSRLHGRVYVRSNRLDRSWQLLRTEQELRSHSVASVAANKRRFGAFSAVRDRVFSHDGVVYHLAGNPMWAGLLLGQVGSVVETQKVTLHDSVFLIPHMLLGGKVENDHNDDLDYIRLYEENAGSFDPRATPIPPFVAYCGGVNPLEDTGKLRLSSDLPTVPAVEEDIPLPGNADRRYVDLPDDIFGPSI